MNGIRRWRGDELLDEGAWVVRLGTEQRAEIVRAGRRLAPAAAYPALRASDFGWNAVGALAADVGERVWRGLGFTVLRGFPVDELTEAQTACALYGLGLELGWPVSQTRKGDLLARIEDEGLDYADPRTRGHKTRDALAFHSDRCDVIGLLCLRLPLHGGLSRLVNAQALHDEVGRRRPELLDALFGRFPNDRRGEHDTGTAPWSEMPVFAHVGGRLLVRYIRRFIRDCEAYADAPKLTPRQRAALDLLDEVMTEPGVALDLDFRVGDLQLVNNAELLHSRTAFEDSRTPEHKRLLLRLWLAHPGSPALPADLEPLYGSVRAGAYRGGVWPPEPGLREALTRVASAAELPCT